MADILTIETHPSAQPRAHIDTQAPPPNEDTIGTEMARPVLPNGPLSAAISPTCWKMAKSPS